MALAPSPEIDRNELLRELRSLGPRVVVRARAAGFRLIRRAFHVTRHQLVRWHRAGLLPRPRRRSLGRGRGMQSLYPAIALAQAGAIVVMQHLFRDLRDVAWCLWCMGFPVTETVRTALLKEPRRWKRRLRAGYREFARGVETNPIAELTRGRAPRGLGYVRRRVGKVNFETLGRMFYEVLLGKFKREGSYGEADYELVTRALGLENADAPVSRKRAKEVAEALDLLSREFNLDALQRAITEAPRGLLCRLRDEAQTRYRSLGLFPGMEQSLLPRAFFFMWLAFRHASPTFQPLMKGAARNAAWATPEPPMLVRLAIDQARQQRQRGRKTPRRRKESR